MTRGAGQAGALVLSLLFACGLARGQEWEIKPVIGGGLPADSGFAAGLEVRRTRLAGPVDGRIKAIGSWRKYEFLEAAVEAPQAGPDWLSLSLTARYRNYPQEDFWGLGADTPQEQRSTYRLEDFDTTAAVGFAFGRIRTGVDAGYLKVNIGPGKDKRFPTALPALTLQPDLRHAGTFLEYNSLDDQRDPHTGGKYRFQFTAFDPGFRRYDLDLRRFISIGDADRMAFRAQTLFTDTSRGETAPFFLLPFMGGTDTVRGFRQYRYRDNHALLLNAEYRRSVSGFFDAVVFADAGRVFAQSSDFGLKKLRNAAGIGGRLKFGRRTFFGADVAFSKEGHRLWFRSGHMF